MAVRSRVLGQCDGCLHRATSRTAATHAAVTVYCCASSVRHGGSECAHEAGGMQRAVQYSTATWLTLNRVLSISTTGHDAALRNTRWHRARRRAMAPMAGVPRRKSATSPLAPDGASATRSVA